MLTEGRALVKHPRLDGPEILLLCAIYRVIHIYVQLFIHINTFKYHVLAPMGGFQLELIYLYFLPSFHLTVVVSVL